MTLTIKTEITNHTKTLVTLFNTMVEYMNAGFDDVFKDDNPDLYVLIKSFENRFNYEIRSHIIYKIVNLIKQDKSQQISDLLRENYAINGVLSTGIIRDQIKQNKYDIQDAINKINSYIGENKQTSKYKYSLNCLNKVEDNLEVYSDYLEKTMEIISLNCA